MNLTSIIKVLIIALFGVFSVEVAIAQIAYKGFNIYVSDSFRSIEMDKTLSCPTGDGALLSGIEYHDTFVVDLNSSVSAHLMIFNESDVRLNKRPLTPIVDQLFNGVRSFTIDIKQFNTDVFAFIDCRNTSGTVQVRIVRNGVRSGSAKISGMAIFGMFIDKIEPFYNWPKITFSSAPCGSVNAMSSPDILVCTELIGDLIHKNLEGALYPILLHELGHSVLKLWGFPGYDNEDIADEFATYILSLTPDGRQNIDDYIRWLETHDSVSEAVAQIAIGDRHTISLQRARNIREAMKRPQDIRARWGKMLKAYKK